MFFKMQMTFSIPQKAFVCIQFWSLKVLPSWIIMEFYIPKIMVCSDNMNELNLKYWNCVQDICML